MVIRVSGSCGTVVVARGGRCSWLSMVSSQSWSMVIVEGDRWELANKGW